MEYRNLGKSGLKVSALSFGSWLTFKSLDTVKAQLRAAFDLGINFFDNAEGYGQGEAELLMGEALKDFRRQDLVLSTKIFHGGNGVNASGLSAKHIIEGLKNSLRRLQVEYVDLMFCHRPDPNTPVEETMRAIDALIKQGLIIYWGTSGWSAAEIEQACSIAKELRLTPPTMEQPEYNMFNRNMMEKELPPVIEKYGLGTTTWSPLNSGILTGKYRNGIPIDSRLHESPWLLSILTKEKMQKVEKLANVASGLKCSLAQLAIAWVLKNRRVSSVILGASNAEQLQENVKALDIQYLLDGEVMKQITSILNG